MMIAVCDGLGGAGSVPISVEGKTNSSAYNASRIVVEALEQYFSKPIGENTTSESLKKELKGCIQESLEKFAQKYIKSDKSMLKTKLVKGLPTTLAGMYVYPVEDGKRLKCFSFWAGDSRNYCISPSLGLQQLSRDDLKGNADALENLSSDSLMSNYVHLEGNYHINCEDFVFDEPVVLLSATDGCYDFIPSPMEFEYTVLGCLTESEKLEDFDDKFKQKLRSIPTGDDSTLVLTYLGFTSFIDLKNKISQREKYIDVDKIAKIKTYDNEIKRIDSQINDLVDESKRLKNELHSLKEKIWKEYREDYYKKLITKI